MGLYTQQDPIGIAGGLNLYGYANGDPVNFSDPFGLCPISKDGIPCALVGALGGAAAIGTAGAVAGASAGTLVVPVFGTIGGAAGGGFVGAVGGFITGGLAGGLQDLINVFTTRPGDLPARGRPNSSEAKDYGQGEGQIRDYGPDGRAQTDFDFGHDYEGAGDPHAHDWDWSQARPRQPARPIRPNEIPPQGGV